MPLKQLPGLRPDTHWPLLGVNWSFQDNRIQLFVSGDWIRATKSIIDDYASDRPQKLELRESLLGAFSTLRIRLSSLIGVKMFYGCARI
jgi:hypothetical protein